jgi:choline dehydrogenase
VNCDLVTGIARRVLFTEGRATGVEIDTYNGLATVRARREVILSASSINSPKLLMLSGVGPAAHLRDMSIPVRADRPGVGANLQDHLEIYVQVASRLPVSLFRHWNLRGKAAIGARWLLTGRGLGASNQFEAGAFLRSSPGKDYPDVQFHFLPIAVSYDGRAAAQGHGFQAHVGPMRSPSRGSVTLRSPDPAAAPRIRFNYMAHAEDWADFRAAIRLARRVFGQPAFAPFAGRRLGPALARTATRPSTGPCASTPSPPITPAGPVAWATRTTPVPSWTPRRGSSAWRGCAWPTRRSSPASPTATSTRRRS